MIEISRIDQLHYTSKDGVVAALGFFDGVHRAHQEIISECVEIARARQGIAAVFTFRTHPSRILSPDEQTPLLTPHAIKREILAKLGINLLVAPEFDRSLAEIPPRRFVEDVLAKRLAARVLLAGFNFRFGHRAGGDVEMLSSYRGSLFEEVRIIPRFEFGDAPLNSTRIRNCIVSGNLPAAELMLGRRYCLMGKVIFGDHRGRLLGFPTGNLQVIDQPLPPQGIYGVRVSFEAALSDGIDGLMYIGTAPTFHTQTRESLVRVEVFLMDWEGDLYGRQLFVEVMCHIRDDKAFGSADELVNQMRKDQEFFRRWLQEQTP